MRAGITSRIIEMHLRHPGMTMPQVAEACGCAREYVRVVAQRHNVPFPGRRPSTATTNSIRHIRCPVDVELHSWLRAEAMRMGNGVRVADVVRAILIDAFNEDAT